LGSFDKKVKKKKRRKKEKDSPFVVENTSIKVWKYPEVDGSTKHSYEQFPLVVLFSDCP
jgi:hypothetical protein